ncbi:MAG: potassium channel family protein [Clostridiales bacterium]|nr:potassium channel family protein [Clostridiales bacterium]
MNKVNLHKVFMGLLSLMSSIIIVIKLMYSLPDVVQKSLLYINLIIAIIFLLDYIFRISKSKNIFRFIFSNKVDLISLIPIIYIDKLSAFLIVDYNINLIFNLVYLFVLIIKFKNNIKYLVRENKFNYLLILTTIIIVLGAVVISLLEEMSFVDAVWWSFVTFTTVGYGDILIESPLGKLVAILLMTLGVGFISVTTSTMAVYIINKEGYKKQKKGYREHTIDLIKYNLDNIDDLSDEDLENIYYTLKGLKRNKK